MSREPAAARPDVLAFAVKWRKIFASPDTTAQDVTDGRLGEECRALGFPMDCGPAFDEAYGGALPDPEALEQIIDGVDDLPLLGSAIYAQWRRFSHRAYAPDEMLSEENRAWFLTALSRLAVLADPEAQDPVPGTRTIQKIRICSDTDNGDNCLRLPGEELKQHLTVTRDGRVFFSSYLQGTFWENRRQCRMRRFRMDPAGAERMLTACEQYFFRDFVQCFATDSGSWTAEITDDSGAVSHFAGFLGQEIPVQGEDLSDLVRRELCMQNLFVFDGQSKPEPDPIARIELDYTRTTEIRPEGPEDAACCRQEYSEQLVIDRASETITHNQEIGTGCSVRRVYRVTEGVSAFLDGLEEHTLFRTVMGNPPTAIRDPGNQTGYTISVDYEKRPRKVLSGSYDKNGLPVDFGRFIQRVQKFLSDFGIGELFDPSRYGKVLRREGELMFCSVVFEDGGREYCYRTEDDSLSEGDLVLVPAGPQDHESVARIAHIVYRTPERAPYPIDQVKYVLGRYTPKDGDEETEALRHRLWLFEAQRKLQRTGDFRFGAPGCTRLPAVKHQQGSTS